MASSIEEPPVYGGYTDDVSSQIHSLARTFTNQSDANVSNSSVGEEDVHNLGLVRTLSHYSLAPASDAIPYANDIDPRLNPESDQFDSKFWLKNMRKMTLSNVDYYKPSDLGFAYKNLRAFGRAADADYQSNFGNIIYKYVNIGLSKLRKTDTKELYDILKPMDGIAKPGEVTVVLGRPGAGCSTFLKTVACETYGFHVDENSFITYDGLTPHDIQKHYRGEVVYCAETESHFPHLTVGDTLEFAAKLRTPQNRPQGVTRELYAKHMTDVMLATYGLSHTKNTKVGDDYVRGVSGGERKRVSICEVALSQASLQCWDNSTRGLDSATALEFIRALKTSAQIENTTPLIAIYQCSKDAYDLFDKVILLYKGYQIYFGKATEAKEYFIKMGYHCPARQTTADFLTSITNPAEREVAPGYENKVPRTPEEFYEYWQNSPERKALLEEIDQYIEECKEKEKAHEFKESHNAKQSRRARPNSAFMVNFGMQVKYIMHRNVLRIKGNPSIPLFIILSHVAISLIMSSIFYNLKEDSGSFYFRTAAMFFAVLFNAFSSLLEIFALYEARPIVEKHMNYALYHPSADALASIITDLPTKLIVAILFNLILYFMINFRRDVGRFFFYLLMNFTATLVMSHVFRTIGSCTTSLLQAMTPASVILLALTVFTGFVIPTPNMHGWCRWINYLDPLGYAFEALLVNEFHDRNFTCSATIPQGEGYPNSGQYFVCAVVGSVPGQNFVQGDKYLEESFRYYNKHKWRNWGINVAFVVFFLGLYIYLCEINKGAKQKGEILLFQQSALKKIRKERATVTPKVKDIETGDIEKYKNSTVESESSTNSKEWDSVETNKLEKHTDIFHWRDLTYEVKIKTENRVILSSVDGWVKPGQVTALMGASGAGKTTLLNALSERLTSGTITSGTRMVNGNPLDSSFQRSIGYVQQQDLHLQTSTVREALAFSAYLRQPESVSKKEKDEYVEYTIKLLEMEKYADAIVGVAGEGLNVEQRKRLTIGVELVAKPKLLVFLDEPTSGLDSQTAWSICKLIRKLADHGQAILCTIHQPSAILLAEFDRLLFLQKGGQTVYFGDLGDNCETLINYFEKYGAHKCPPDANPAEWMLDVIGAAPGSHASQDYYQVWINSSEYADVHKELDTMEIELLKLPNEKTPDDMKTFAAPIWKQYLFVTERVFQQYWRSPSYTYSKVLLTIISTIFNGFSFFKADRSLQGLQNQMFSVFMFMVIFLTLIQQYLPYFVSQRDLYEVRERPSKTFSWIAFILAQITAEIPWNILCGTFAYFCWYYPIGLYNNAIPTDSVHERGAFMWFTIVLFFIYTSTMAQWCISFLEVADNAANMATFLFTLCLGFCGVLATKDQFPGFWIFMYRCNPFTYLISIMLSVGLANTTVECSSTELAKFAPYGGMNCSSYMKPYIDVAGGYLVDPAATDVCEYCRIQYTNVFLKSISANYETRGRDLGIFIAFIFVDVIGTILFYYLARVPKGSRQKKKAES